MGEQTRRYTPWSRSISFPCKREVNRGSSGPVAVRNELGWLISGPVANDSLEVCRTNCVVSNLSIVEGRINSKENEMREKEEALLNFHKA